MISSTLIATCLSLAITASSGDVFDKLAGFTEYKAAAVGYAGTKPKVYEAYEEVLELATDNELELGLSHWSPVVRAYAFSGLLSRGYDAQFLSAKLVGQVAPLPTQFGCGKSKTTLGELAQLLIRHHEARKKLQR